MEQLYRQFTRERQFINNVSPRTLEAYAWAWKAFEPALSGRDQVEKLLAGASLEDVSLLLAHRSIKITERHYLKFDQRRQERLTAASMVDWHQIEPAKPCVVKAKRKASSSASDWLASDVEFVSLISAISKSMSVTTNE